MPLDVASQGAIVFFEADRGSLDDESLRYFARLLIRNLNDCAVIDSWMCKQVSLELGRSNLVTLMVC